MSVYLEITRSKNGNYIARDYRVLDLHLLALRLICCWPRLCLDLMSCQTGREGSYVCYVGPVTILGGPVRATSWPRKSCSLGHQGSSFVHDAV